MRIFSIDLGKHAVNALLRPAYAKAPKNAPAVPDRPAAETLVAALLNAHMLVHVAKQPKSKQLALMPHGLPFSPDNYYLFVYQGSQIRSYITGILVIAVVLAGVMFPLWPESMRLIVYYLSLVLMGLFGALMGLGVIRAILWAVLIVTTGRGGWLFPNLFADVGIIESFIPLWAWDEPKSSKKKSKKSIQANSEDSD